MSKLEKSLKNHTVLVYIDLIIFESFFVFSAVCFLPGFCLCSDRVWLQCNCWAAIIKTLGDKMKVFLVNMKSLVLRFF